MNLNLHINYLLMKNFQIFSKIVINQQQRIPIMIGVVEVYEQEIQELVLNNIFAGEVEFVKEK